ncbi:hypothetical protein H072_1992 [Dactylellina haptotyla CBS 200.50]|uniref:CCZ1/INTU/HSP4 first Longin domain-containing protein n=1 Tax=Dactylellina haptotyla (strain CBS 200.50) TaxID=1284197 RepID=S8C8N1_DACHA|nr:hypothetical protein H072_1992 [Dactylellina haptotyla CBS 200.50]
MAGGIVSTFLAIPFIIYRLIRLRPYNKGFQPAVCPLGERINYLDPEYGPLVLQKDNIQIVDADAINTLKGIAKSGIIIKDYISEIQSKLITQPQCWEDLGSNSGSVPLEDQPALKAFRLSLFNNTTFTTVKTLSDWLLGLFYPDCINYTIEGSLDSRKKAESITEFLAKQRVRSQTPETLGGKPKRAQEERDFQNFLTEKVKIFEKLGLGREGLVASQRINNKIGPPTVIAHVNNNVRPDYLCGYRNPELIFSIPPQASASIPRALLDMNLDTKTTKPVLFLPYLAAEFKRRGESENIVRKQLARCLSIIAERQAVFEERFNSQRINLIFGISGIEADWDFWAMIRYKDAKNVTYYDMCQLASYTLTNPYHVKSFEDTLTKIGRWAEDVRKPYFYVARTITDFRKSVDLTQIHYSTDLATTDYSTREVAPASVLISQLKTSYRQFLLFNGTLESVLASHGRDVLVQRLEKFYTRWAWRWEVMLNGNPAVDIWNGIKIGRGVGEEEKEVLGGFADRNREEEDGSERLIDLVVSRFGKLPGDEKDDKKKKAGFSTRGTGKIPGPDDGCIYRGVGNLKKESVRDLAEWMARWYQYGDSSFDYQTARPSRKKARRGKSKARTFDPPRGEQSTIENAPTEGSAPKLDPQTSMTPTTAATTSDTTETETILPPPLFTPENEPQSSRPSPKLDPNSKDKAKGNSKLVAGNSNPTTNERNPDSRSGNNTLMLNVLTLGTYAAYSAWNRSREDQELSKPSESNLVPDSNPAETSGRFIIGYTGALDEEDNNEEDHPEDDPNTSQNDFISTTIWVARNKFIAQDSTAEEQSNIDGSPVLETYPFIFAMLFHSTNESLNKASFFKLLHQQLGPLKGPLIASSEKQYQPSNNKGVYDLIFDPATLTVHTSVPSIPEPVYNNPLEPVTSSGLPRIEALHVHSQVIRVIEDTRWRDIPLGSPSGERERTNRTTRGWWVAWMRLEGVETQVRMPQLPSTSPGGNLQVERQGLVPPEDDIASFIGSVSKHRRGRREAFIIRKGSEHRTHMSSA